MIQLLVDEAAAFDAIAILLAKKANGLDIGSSLDVASKSLVNQLGDRLRVVVESEEFADLVLANLMTFAAVDLAQSDCIRASEVDMVNQLRFEAKRKLQNRFWPNRLLTETKQTR